MKHRILLIILVSALHTVAAAQGIEWKLAFNSGLFSFTGASAASVSAINYDRARQSGYTNNPYGSNSGLCYGFSTAISRVSKRRVIIGLDGGFEVLRSSIAINAVNLYNDTTTSQYSASGKTILSSSFFTLVPFAGYRISSLPVTIDITAGLDIAYCFANAERGKATAGGTEYRASAARKIISGDIRPDIRIAATYSRVGIYAGYAFGLANYKSGYIGGVNECYGRMFRFGMMYRIH